MDVGSIMWSQWSLGIVFLELRFLIKFPLHFAKTKFNLKLVKGLMINVKILYPCLLVCLFLLFLFFFITVGVSAQGSNIE